MHPALAAAAIAVLPVTAWAQCALGKATPIAAEALRHQVVEEVHWAFLSPILTGEYGEPYTLIDPLQPGRAAEVDNNVKLGVVTPSRGLAVQAYQGGKLYAGPLGPGAKLKVIHEAAELRPVLDAVDGAGGETWVVLQERPRKGPGGLTVFRIDAAGKLGAGTVVARGNVLQARLARLADGRLAVAYSSFSGGQRYSVTSLFVAWLDAKGQAQGEPVRLDSVLGTQTEVDVALAVSGKGVVAAWNPITSVPAGKVDSVPVELRAFHLDPGGAPVLTRRDALSGAVWHIPEAGGILPNLVQAASVDGQAVLIWEQLVSKTSMPLFAAPAEGGAPVAIAGEPEGNPLLRADGKQLVVLWWDRNAYQHSRATLTCKAGPPGPAPAPLDPPPPNPSTGKLARADYDKAWKHLEALAGADPKAKDLLDELHAMKPADKAAAEEKLGSDEGRAEGRYDCVMATRRLEQLDKCYWP